MIEIAVMCLSLNVYWEARNQPVAGQVAVAQVVMNRVLDERYPNTVCGVVYENKQFSWYWDGKPDVPYDQESWEQAQLIADAVIAGSGHSDLEGVTHYHAVYVQPYWINDPAKMEYVAQVGDHKFYKDIDFEDM